VHQGSWIALAGILGFTMSVYMDFCRTPALLHTLKNAAEIKGPREHHGQYKGTTMVRNPEVQSLLKLNYTTADIDDIMVYLDKQGALRFAAFDNGLFPAAADAGGSAVSGYGNVWVRDNFYIAYAHYVAGKKDKAVKNARALAAYFQKYRHRFENIIRGTSDRKQPHDRPHVRFNGLKQEELPEKWAHVQNDALGYFLWFFCKLIVDGELLPERDDLALLARFAFYFEAIPYWEDEDSGHWEEKPKVEASSIGVVTGALDMLRRVVDQPLAGKEVHFDGRPITSNWLQALADRGRAALNQILPKECIQPQHARDDDAALLFLIYPIGVASEDQASQIIRHVIDHLQGLYGIRRYLGDSYWCADYKKHFPPTQRTIDFSDSMAERDAFWREGEEAQWCIFDTILSVIFGKKYQQTKDRGYLHSQVAYLNRSLGQLTASGDPSGPCKCPEAYYLEDGSYVPNDQTPLLWTQANLWLALVEMRESLRLR
jgi:phosphorylase kinase alpha/beta subunit